MLAIAIVCTWVNPCATRTCNGYVCTGTKDAAEPGGCGRRMAARRIVCGTSINHTTDLQYLAWLQRMVCVMSRSKRTLLFESVTYITDEYHTTKHSITDSNDLQPTKIQNPRFKHNPSSFVLFLYTKSVIFSGFHMICLKFVLGVNVSSVLIYGKG